MPKLSPTMESGIITQWLIKVGDPVKEGDALADIETDKATMQMKSYDDGIVAHLDHDAGAEVALGERVLVLAKKGEDPKQVAAALGSANGQVLQKASATAARVGQPAAQVNHAPSQPTSGNSHQDEEPVAVGGRVKSSPLARKVAAEQFAMYGHLPSYRAMLDREGYAGPPDAALIGDEGEVSARLAELPADKRFIVAFEVAGNRGESQADATGGLEFRDVQ